MTSGKMWGAHRSTWRCGASRRKFFLLMLLAIIYLIFSLRIYVYDGFVPYMLNNYIFITLKLGSEWELGVYCYECGHTYKVQ